ncbi:MAG: ABC transporter permease [Candidatus Dormibacteraeota bacterium]|nr:ABC transporter permease [Candidatus Dormibacteraeota bacterium]
MSAALGVLQYNLLSYSRNWRGSAFSSVLAPVVFLAAMGIGLGGLINRRSGGVEGIPYLLFLAPGLLATNAMQTSVFLSTYPILVRARWHRTYEALLATPVRIGDLLAGELAWMALRLLQGATIFLTAMALFGAVRSPEGVLAIPVAVLTGLAFACPITAFAATRQSDLGFILLQRLLVIPLFLFGGAFFPLDRLPLPLQAIAWATPLAHGVVLARGLTLGTLSLASAWPHLAVLLAYAVLGAIAAWAALRRRLVW